MRHTNCGFEACGVSMAIFNIFGKRDSSSDLTKVSPYRISSEWVPYKIYSDRKSTASLYVKVKNQTNEVLLTSVVVELPQQLSFDEVGVAKEHETHLGELKPGEERDTQIEVHGGLNADPGEYTVTLTAIAHYRDYGHVINAVKKRTTLSVV